MNVLDEDIPEGQALLLKSWRIRARQIGRDVGRLGMQDDAIIPMLLQRLHAAHEVRLNWGGRGLWLT